MLGVYGLGFALMHTVGSFVMDIVGAFNGIRCCRSAPPAARPCQFGALAPAAFPGGQSANTFRDRQKQAAAGRYPQA